MRASVGDCRHQRRCRRTRADHHDLLAVDGEIVGPALWVHDTAFELFCIRPFGREAFGMPIVALAHPEEVRGKSCRLAGVGPHRVDGPEIAIARPARGLNPVPVADMLAEIVLGDDLAHVGEDFGCGRDRRADPRLEAVAEGMEIAVGADAGIAMREPGAAEALLALQDDEARIRKLLCQLIGTADAGDAGADDENVEMFGGLLRGRRNSACGGNVHFVYRSLLGFLGGQAGLKSPRWSTHASAWQNDTDQMPRLRAQNPIAARSVRSSRGKALVALRRSGRRSPRCRSGRSTS